MSKLEYLVEPDEVEYGIEAIKSHLGRGAHGSLADTLQNLMLDPLSNFLEHYAAQNGVNTLTDATSNFTTYLELDVIERLRNGQSVMLESIDHLQMLWELWQREVGYAKGLFLKANVENIATGKAAKAQRKKAGFSSAKERKEERKPAWTLWQEKINEVIAGKPDYPSKSWVTDRVVQLNPDIENETGMNANSARRNKHIVFPPKK